jgi:hypothetical protein
VEATHGPKIAKLLRVKYVYETTGVKVLSHLETLRQLAWVAAPSVDISTPRHHTVGLLNASKPPGFLGNQDSDERGMRQTVRKWFFTPGRQGLKPNLENKILKTKGACNAYFSNWRLAGETFGSGQSQAGGKRLCWLCTRK